MGKRSKQFFFEKKNKSLLVPFFKKELRLLLS